MGPSQCTAGERGQISTNLCLHQPSQMTLPRLPWQLPAPQHSVSPLHSAGKRQAGGEEAATSVGAMGSLSAG